ncbi:MAG: DUF3352 domain-containing protein, partial [Cyanobacteria bacterium]|nr:DUF3352 domain-containing protein [Cyanobacteriota bacterium]MDW8202939.1 DUF3352 domain-containing protein [Cyanobacteriota bacterium SKYGB_h_bin112]
ADCLMAIASNNLQQQWQGWFATDADLDLTATLIKVWIDSLQAQWGIDVAQDIVPWVTGDYALAILHPMTPATSYQGNALALDWVFVTQRSPATAAALERLDQLARRQGLSIGTLQIDEQPVSTWTALATNPARQQASSSSLTLDVNVKGAHATVGDYELVASSIDAIHQALQAPTTNSLFTSDRFQTTISPLPTPNSGYVYLDWVAADNLLESQFPILKFVKFAGSALFSHLQSVAVSSYQGTTKASSRPARKGEVFIHLGDSKS